MRILALLILLLPLNTAYAKDKIEIATVEPSRCDLDGEPNIDYNWLAREINNTWVFVKTLIGPEMVEPPKLIFDCTPRKPSLEAYSPDEIPPAIHISWDIFRINDHPGRMKISGYIEWAAGHGFMHYLLMKKGVSPEIHHCEMLYQGHAKRLLLWLDSQYHTPGYHVDYPELGGILTRTGMHEIKEGCGRERSGSKTRVHH